MVIRTTSIIKTTKILYCFNKKYHKKASKILLNHLRISKEKGAEEIILFVSTDNPKNPGFFPIIRQTFENLLKQCVMSLVVKR